MSLHVRPTTLRAANEYVRLHHRHHPMVQGCVFCIQVVDSDDVCHGVAIIGRPVARLLQDGTTAEVTRLCTDGTPNACSILYAAAWRAAREMGYRRMFTYILESEPGISLKAAGWKDEGPAGGGSWDTPSRRRVDKAPTVPKRRWCVKAA